MTSLRCLFGWHKWEKFYMDMGMLQKAPCRMCSRCEKFQWFVFLSDDDDGTWQSTLPLKK